MCPKAVVLKRAFFRLSVSMRIAIQQKIENAVPDPQVILIQRPRYKKGM